MRLTFTQLSTLQRQEIYSAGGLGWSWVSTWAGPHDDPVAQPCNEAGLKSNRGEKTERGRDESPGHLLWQIPIDALEDDNKRCASPSTLKRLAKLITQFHLSHSEDSPPWILPRREEETSNLPGYAKSGTASTTVCLNTDCNLIFAARKIEKKQAKLKLTELLAFKRHSEIS